MKKILLLFWFLLFLFTNNTFATSSNNNLINVTWVIRGDDWTYYNYLHLAIKDKEGIICKWETKQTFKKIDDLTNWYTTDILKVDNSWFLDFNCDKNRLLKNWKINPNVKLVIFSDWFYSIKNTYINISPNLLKVYDNRIIIWNFKNIKTNFKIEIKKINNVLFNNFDIKVKKIISQLKKEEDNKIKNKNIDISQLDNIILKVQDIPNDINLTYQYNNIIKKYNKQDKNIIIVRWKKIDKIKIGEKVFTNLEIKGHILNIKYSPDMYNKKVKLSIVIKNIPKIKKDIIIYIDWKKYIYNKELDIILNPEQVKKWISIKIWKYKIKKIIKKDVILEIDYKDIIKDELQLKDIDNKILILKLNTSLLDWLRRIVLNEEYENGWIVTKIFTVKDYFINWKYLYLKYKKINEEIPNNIIINNKKFSIKDISFNLKEFLINKYK